MTIPATHLDSPFLQRAALAGLRHLRFVPRQRIDGHAAGRHRSHRPGGVAEFVDYRAYSAGDDLRHLDWKVLARTGRPYARLYQDDARLRCTVCIDASGSMDFGPSPSLTKLEYAQFVATALGELIAGQQDSVGVAIAADGLVRFVRPAASSGHARRVQEVIASLSPTPSSRLDLALHQLFLTDRRRGTLMVISDFLVDDVPSTFASLRRFRERRSDVLLLHLVHPLEQRLPAGNAWRFDDAKTTAASTARRPMSPRNMRSPSERIADRFDSSRLLAAATINRFRRQRRI